ncbi:hypothetical protein [Bradyrhizobium cytisi]|uniref:Sugar phosphate isomerase/epimerase n=1 Tax=Bradyrhizobium cytisi TaxID=515489 RepID=A0A5S4WI12_9BRAD|nr:hypothetical protein [Bradyrhizobium cytisi]TYL79834.1 hypothetical protein FXB38_26730 [Bradyrhizobium cytisi]
MMVGFSTGALAYGDFGRALKLLEPTRANAVELSALRCVELPVLLNALPSLLEKLCKRYQYISFHAPTDFDDEQGVVRELANVAKLGLNIVVHPDTLRDLSLWRELGSRLCVENMDSRKPTGRTAEELGEFFVHLPDARLCFDIAHARQVDPTMTVAARILSEFGAKIAQVHVSELNSKGKHFAMSYGAKRAYESFAARLSQVPIILESVVRETEISSEISETEKVFSYGVPDGSRGIVREHN